MGRKPKTSAPKRPPKMKPKEQSERFIATAREYGVDETGKEFERLFRKVVPSKERRGKS